MTAELRIDLFDVIATPPRGKGGFPFGQTFTDEATAGRYADALIALGYSADVTPAYSPVHSVAEAMEHARAIFGDARLQSEPVA